MELFNLAAAIALVLCFATVIVWVRSYFLMDYVVYPSPDRQIVASSNRGTIVLFDGPKGNDSRPPRWVHGTQPLIDTNIMDGATVLGFGHVRSPHGFQAVSLPFWFLAALLLVAPVWRLRREVTRARRQHRGACVRCGYDLRASPNRCPECGTVPEGAAGAVA